MPNPELRQVLPVEPPQVASSDTEVGATGLADVEVAAFVVVDDGAALLDDVKRLPLDDRYQLDCGSPRH